MSAIMIPNRMLPQMVAQRYYEDDEPSFRRYSSRGHGYPLSHDRDLPSGPGHNVYSRSHMGSQDSRNGDHHSENEEIPRARSRIPVACGRCRKRKIRCSGDNGGPCTNCKSAGNDSCAFLRVSSQDLGPMKNETPAYDFDSSAGAGSRLNCRMVPSGPYSIPPQGPSLGYDPYVYRNNSLSAYQYGVRPFYPSPPYGDFGDDNIEYGQCLSTYQLLPSAIPADQMGLPSNYTNPPPLRTWGSTPQLQKSLPFLEVPTLTYGHGQLPYNGNSYDPRSNVGAEQKTISSSGVASSLPAPVNTGIERMLPSLTFPANTAPVSRPQAGQYLPSADNLLPSTQTRGQYIDYNTVQTVKSQNNNAVAENGSLSASSYLPLSSNSPESLGSSQTNYPTPAYSVPSSQPNVYTPPQSHDGLFHPGTEASESSYSPSNNTERSRNNSRSRQGGGSHDGLPSFSSSTSGTLANDRPYIPPIHYPQQHYPQPPVALHPQPPRRQSGVLA
ncbi:uncharacterized protein PAC_03190 [Phialocephala subalpina]|uniref:Zn(2)-C6 fungal-type domain-containing protein n=1 Tax=Phialocephala subalpina TaxID=576137 RepID=A0A1L7WKK5_9HELO|nr:uncharacterized protein PAC_03190 [Phialocephala subalpina]